MNFSLPEGFLHHAYLVEGEHKEIFPLLVDFLKKQKLISVTGDIYQKFSETFTIDFSRLIKSHQIEKSPHKFFILGANFFTREAANSLLKVLEEPAPGTHFFLVTPNPHLLPETLKSRLHILSLENKKEINSLVLQDAKKFLAAGIGQRIKIIEGFLKKFEGLEAGENNIKSSALEFLNAIEFVFYEAVKDRALSNRVFEFEELAKVRDYISDRGASTKMLFEHLALILIC